jgi:hypothetical protein
MAIVAEVGRGAARAALVVILLVRGASADSSSVAQALFDRGRRLLEQGDVSAACAMFAESQRVQPAGGTLMNLAACHAREGKTATAWAEFNDALAQAKRDGRNDRVGEAKRQIEQLEPHLARVRIAVGSTAPDGLVLRLDGTVLGLASSGTAVPVDPGPHSVDATAVGRVPWAIAVDVPPHTTVQVDVPSLASAPTPTPTPAQAADHAPVAPSPEITSPHERPSRVPAFLIGAIGVVGLGIGIAMDVVASSKHADLVSKCVGGCSSAERGEVSDFYAFRAASAIAYVTGVLGIAGGATLWLLSPSPSASRAASTRLSISPGSIGVGGQF